MHFVVAALAALAAVYFFVMRARNAAEMTTELLDVADDVRAAARRFGFRRHQQTHPVDSIDDPNLAMATIAVAYMELQGLPTEDAKSSLLKALQRELDVDVNEAEELAILGRWLMNECSGAMPAIARTSKKLYRLDKNVSPLMEVLKDLSDTPLGDRQCDALHDIKRAFHIT
ncbi:MAG: hypothetical protein ACR2OY_04790 [Boseongicola sp.]